MFPVSGFFLSVCQVFFACQNHPEVLKHSLLFLNLLTLGHLPKKTVFRQKNPILGEGVGGDRLCILVAGNNKVNS